MKKPFSGKIAYGKRFMKKIMSNRRLVRALKFGITAVFTALVLAFSGIKVVDEVTAAPNVENFGMKITLLEWYRVYELGTGDFRGALVWGNGNPYYFTSGRDIGLGKNADDRPDYWVGKPHTIDPYLDFGKDKFVNRDYHDIPWFINAKSLDSSAAARSGDYLAKSARFSIKLCPDLKHTQWVHTPKNNIVGSNDRSVFNILDYKHDNKGSNTKNMHRASTLTSKGYVRLFTYHGESDCQDFYHSGNYISVHWKDNWPTDDFMLYDVKEKTYSAMSDYTITKGQIFVNKDSSFLLDGKKLKIEEDGVLSVQGTFYYNGDIECAGTIILQEGATMCPYHANQAAGNITLRNGGTIIIMPKARLFAGYPSAVLGTKEEAALEVENGSIINYGLLVSGHSAFKGDAVIEMHDGSLMYTGYSPNKKNINGMFNAFNSDSTPEDLGLVKTRNAYSFESPALYMNGKCRVYLNSNIGGNVLLYNRISNTSSNIFIPPLFQEKCVMSVN